MSLEEKHMEIMDEDEDDEDMTIIKKKVSLMIEKILKEAMNIVQALKKKEAAAGVKYEVPNIIWMKCKDFTIGRGLLQIEDYMRTWELHESWLHWTNYLNNEELQYSTHYRYRVCWSIPTCRKPIPRATACVYFVVEISKIKPSTLPIEVFFVVETNKLIHRPGREGTDQDFFNVEIGRPGESRFKEKWLKDVIESKIIMMETVDF